MGIKAKIEQSNPTCPPTLGKGDVDASVLWDWINQCESFFRHKTIPTKSKVVTIAWGMTGVHAVRWLSANAPLLEAMAWDEYKEHMCGLFLPSDWEHSACMDVLRLQQGPRTFVDFSQHSRERETMLRGSNMGIDWGKVLVQG
ncbi:hypothetical protein PTI98_002015 [Pleurotus ostreatus]|nr:hypothetical protein PTI98_002015 [Pleurotus ostreatus]